MYASLNYIQTRHPYGDIPGQPSQAPAAAALTNGASQSRASTFGLESQQQDTAVTEQPAVFSANLRELAQDLILKEQQIEHLINSLPGIDQSEANQELRMRELQTELQHVEAERARKEDEREELVNMLGEVIGKVKRIH